MRILKPQKQIHTTTNLLTSFYVQTFPIRDKIFLKASDRMKDEDAAAYNNLSKLSQLSQSKNHSSVCHTIHGREKDSRAKIFQPDLYWKTFSHQRQ